MAVFGHIYRNKPDKALVSGKTTVVTDFRKKEVIKVVRSWTTKHYHNEIRPRICYFVVRIDFGKGF